MKRYFFHVGGAVPFEDRIGIELDDDDAAWSNAVRSMGELLDDLDGKMPNRAAIITVVANDAGEPVITLRFTGERNLPVQ